jgi:hypothetical protein
MTDMTTTTTDGSKTESERLADKSTAAFVAADQTKDPGLKATELRKAQQLAGESELAAAYTYLQRVVGWIAVLLPFVLAIGNMFFNGVELKGSISAYYYTRMGGVFVGALWALGVFFLSYNHRPLSKYRTDNVLSNVACAAAVGVALFPTASSAAGRSGGEKFVSVVHLGCAALLFGLLAYFSLFLFTLHGDAELTPDKVRRNVVHRVCGVVIVVAMALVLVSNAVKPPSSWHALFWLEAAAVVAFGISWLVKGYAPKLWAAST